MASTTHSSASQVASRDLFLPWRVVGSLKGHLALLRQFVKRDVQSRYRGSYFGVFLALLRPLALLAIYTVVFGFVFQARLGSRPEESKLDFTLALFCGLIVFEFFAESLGRAPTTVLANPNYVKRVVFPLEILPLAAVGAALTQLAISLVPFFAALLLAHGGIPLTALLLPVILLPLILLTLGAAWILASFGVFVRDINVVVPVALQVLMFASAVFYPLSRVPAKFLPFVLLNPLAVIVNQARDAVLWGLTPDWTRYFLMLLTGLAVFVCGYAFFMRTKRAFADVI